jgi:hypothetical protein
MPWRRVDLEKQTAGQPVKKFSAFYSTHPGTYPAPYELSKKLCILVL